MTKTSHSTKRHYILAIVFLTVIPPIAELPFAKRARIPHPRAEQVTFGPLAEMGPVVSPDSQWIAFEYFRRDFGSNAQIWAMPASGDFASAFPLVNDGEYHAGISWSPNSEWVSFVAAVKTAKDLNSGAPKPNFATFQVFKVHVRSRKVAQISEFPDETTLGDDTTWSKTGLIAYQRDGDIYALPSEGGPESKLLDLKSLGLQIGNPASITWSPDASRLAFGAKKVSATEDHANIWIANLREKTSYVLTTTQTVGSVSWIDNQTLLITMVDRGQATLHSFALDSGKTKRLTDGPFEMAGDFDHAHGILFFDHSEKAEPSFDAWIPRLHVWKKRVSVLAEPMDHP